MDKVTFSRQLVEQILDYLAKRPWVEVNNLIVGIQDAIAQEAKKENKEE